MTEGGVSCEKAIGNLRYWMIFATALPSFINLVIVAFFIRVFFMVKSFSAISDEIVSSTHCFSRTTVRVGLGPIAKKVLLEYAKTKPKYQKLVTTPNKQA